MAFLGLDSPIEIFLFTAYIATGNLIYLLVHRLQVSGLKYNSTTVVFLQELTKLGFSGALFCVYDGRFADIPTQLRHHKKLFLLYFVPASLYALSNNLTFLGLAHFDPATFDVLIQVRIILAAVMSTLFLGRVVARGQWAALALIMVGCMVKEAPNLHQHYYSDEAPNRNSGSGSDSSSSSYKYLVVLVVVLCSTFAGIYNEKLLKNVSASPNIQNMFMYLCSMICNAAALVLRSGDLDAVTTAFSAEEMAPIMSFDVLVVVVSAACMGVVTGFFLKYLNNVVKNICNAIELFTMAFFSWVLFGYPITTSVVLAVALVSSGVLLFNKFAPKTDSHPHEKGSDEQTQVELRPIVSGSDGTAAAGGLGMSDGSTVGSGTPDIIEV